MEYAKLKLLEGLNIYGKRNIIYLKVKSIYKKELDRIIGQYKEIASKFNIASELTTLETKEDYIEVCFCCDRIEVSKFILDSLLNSENIEEINKGVLNKLNSDWKYILEKKSYERNIPFIRVNDEEVQLGYGVNSIRILKEGIDFEKFKNINLINNGLIPIISVTGTNGKTTTVRLIHNILLELGYNSGLSSTGGIFIGKKIIRQGDTTGFYSAREVLKNKSVEIAVLETARGGILKKGLGYQYAKVAIITSISEDHIGLEGIRTIQDLADIKGVVGDELLPDGILIIRAIEVLFNKYKERKNLVLFEYEKNSIIEAHLKNGKKAYYIEDGKIIEEFKEIKKEIISIDKIPFTFYGISKSNVKNVIASIAAVVTIHKNINEITEVLKKVKCDIYSNLGRQNIIDFNYFKLIIDYGHNSEAFDEVFSIAKAMRPKRITALITAAGDREDKYIIELGAITAGYSHKIIIKEQPDLRGRKVGEIAELLKYGALKAGFSKENIKVILDEALAIEKSLEEAVDGEVIVSFSQFLYITIPAINKFRKDNGMEIIGEDLDLSH